MAFAMLTAGYQRSMAGINVHMVECQSAVDNCLLDTRFLQGCSGCVAGRLSPVLSIAIDCKNKTLNRG